MDTSNNPEDLTMLHTLVQTLQPAPASWPLWTVKILGRAGKIFYILKKMHEFINKLFQIHIQRLKENWKN